MDLAELQKEIDGLREWRHKEFPTHIARLDLAMLDASKQLARIDERLEFLAELHPRTARLDVEVTGVRGLGDVVKKLEKTIYGNGDPGLKELLAQIRLRQTVLVAILAPIPPLLVGIAVAVIKAGWVK